MVGSVMWLSETSQFIETAKSPLRESSDLKIDFECGVIGRYVWLYRLSKFVAFTAAKTLVFSASPAIGMASC